MAAGVAGAELVHSHTWYANLGGHLAKLVHGIPHVATVHSLEPMRPWKREQLGGGYALSSFAERTALEAADAIVAVSAAHLREILACYPADRSGADERDLQRDRRRRVPARSAAPTCSSATGSTRRGRRSSSSAGSRARRASRTSSTPRRRSTRTPSSCSAPARRTRRRSPREIAAKMAAVRASRGNVIWIEEMLPKPDVIQILSHATVFVCPSVYEPMGIVNLEAMACEAAGRRDRGRRHPRGRRGRRHRAARPLRGAARRNGHAGRPGRARGRSRGAGQRAPRRPGRAPRRWAAPAGRGRSSASAGTSPRRRRSRSTSGCSGEPGASG